MQKVHALVVWMGEVISMGNTHAFLRIKHF